MRRPCHELRGRGRALCFSLYAMVAGCSPREPPHSAQRTDQLATVTRISPAAAPPPAPATPAPSPASSLHTHSAILDATALRQLENSGFALSELVLGKKATTTAELSKLPGWKSIFDVLRSEIAVVKRAHPLARVTSIDGFRLFDERFLDSSELRFELIGVFNRLDRRVFYAGTCGEIRFLYRLRYDTEQGGKPMGSRLPMTLNVAFLVEPKALNCQEHARSWQAPREVAPAAFGAWSLATGALAPAQRAAWTLKSVETNLQTFRIQSSVNVSLAGHIEYSLRVFHPTNAERSAFAPALLENMPDVPLLKRDATLRADLLSYLKRAEVLAAVDRGTLNLPERFLTKGATSVSPRGLIRPGNRPFRSLFEPRDFAGLDLSRYRSIGSSAALLRRLDGASCTGCHQSRTLAGFHHLGIENEGPPSFVLHSGMSPHLENDLERRREYVEALASGRTPDEFRPIPERQGVGRGFGAPCGLGDPGFFEWTCEAGLSCQKIEDPEIGVCAGEPQIGSACEYGAMAPGTKPHRDRVRAVTRHACAEGHGCDTNLSGFPQGACSSSCDAAGDAGACGDFLDVDGFQNCLRGRRPFDACAAEFVFRTGLPSCDAAHPCRQDYVCAKGPKEGSGTCVPPYFVYQLRLDGYPLKW